ncbi:hypothetical protein QN277_010436 [Acacia crassicarpa]|uniref:Uncharacterized protein n=1 Tax=Acacia crassicarpa TaxID=499986 RepID=A0AAE1M6N7_9FABA|nr:hypothetical protein QN277_010436 [Acacia crassicarpa]
MLMSHANFGELLADQWRTEMGIDVSLQSFQKALIPWNQNVFGYVEKKKHIILARLNGIQKSPTYPHSQYLCRLEFKL